MATIEDRVKCPQCSAGMVLRTAKKGRFSGQQFYGCSRFPRCKGILKYEETSTASTSEASLISQQEQFPERERNPFLTARAENKSKQITTDGTPLTDTQKKELRKLRDKLLNVTSRNRSIRLSKLYKKSAFDLSLINKIDTNFVNELIIHCRTEDDVTPVLPDKTLENEEVWNRLSNHLKNLYRNITEIYQEKGLYDLYIGYPFLTGKPKGTETIIQAPIFLIPVHLEKFTPKKGMPIWTLRPNEDQKVLFNKTLFFALSKLCNLSVNQDIFDEEVPSELYGEENFIEWTQQLLETYGVMAGIHEEALDEEFDRVKEFTVKEPPDDVVNGGLQIRQHAVLGHFPQSNSSLQKDYEAFLTMNQEDLDGIICFLSEEYLEQDFEVDDVAFESAFDFSENIQNDPVPTIDSRSEKDNFFLLPSDSSQDKILLELNNSSTDGLVVWGPPGTGKSQTIVNVIADCVAKGKTVLLVSQKRAALDVVYKRLASKSMDSLAAVVHDTKEDRKNLYGKLASICTQEANLEQEITDPSTEIESVTSVLKDIAAAYNDNRFQRKSRIIFHELASYRGPTLSNVDKKWLHSKAKEVDELAQMLDSFQKLGYPPIWDELDSKRKDFSNLDFQTLSQVINLGDFITHDKRFKTATEILSIVNSLPIQCESDDLDELKASVQDLKNDHRIFRFITSRYLKNRSIVRKNMAFAKETLQAANEEAKRVLKPIVDRELSRKIDFLNDLQSSVFQYMQISNNLNQYFDNLKALDIFRGKLPKSVKEYETELRAISKYKPELSWGKVFRNSIYQLWANEIENHHPVLSFVKSGMADKQRLRLKELLEEKIEYCVHLLKKRVRRSLDSEGGRQFSRSLSVEVGRKRNIPSVRKLNEKFISKAHFKAMLPVWLVSPESVSDVFPLEKNLFDVVIFDEASQCTVENGLPAIFRGKQIIVAGDEKQLPPSRLFEVEIEENDEDSFATNEPSLLTLAKKTLRYKAMMLEWHYRSKHQELVTFSNEVFYGGRMKIAPNVMPFVKGNPPAIEWHSVTGFWNERTNAQEAEVCVNLIYQHLKSDDSPTIGVITFNINQKNYILDLIDQKMQDDPEFGQLIEENKELPLDQQLFVKNIENVQGDERDVIIFSIAYAPEHPGGRVKQHFGLLNKPGGENRLNVAVTRAITRKHIVASINPEVDLNTSTSAHPGPKVFHKYLCYAKAVADQNFPRIESIIQELNQNLMVRPQTGHLVFDSPFEEDVFNELTLMGYEIHSQVGQSGFRIDLAVVHPNDPSKYILGIECDGATYHSSVSVRERDVFRQRFLETRGWVIHRIWSPSWRENRQRELQRIKHAIESQLDVVLSQASSDE